MKFIKNTIVTAVTLSIMSGCAVQNIEETRQEMSEIATEVERKREQGDTLTRTAVHLSVKDEYYLFSNAIKLDSNKRIPDYFNDKYHFNQTTPVSIRELFDRVSKDTGVRIALTKDALDWMYDVEDDGSSTDGLGDEIPSDDFMSSVIEPTTASMYDDGMMMQQQPEQQQSAVFMEADFTGTETRLRSMKATFQFEGSLKNALDAITQKYDVYWKWENNQIVIFKTEIKSYVFDGNNIQTSFDSQITTSSEGEDAKSSHATRLSATTNRLFDELQHTLSGLVTDKIGSVSISTNTGVITVKDTPEAHFVIEDYITNLNKRVSKNIRVVVSIVEVTSNEDGEYGVDINAMYKGSQRFGFGISPIGGATAGGNFAAGLIDSGSNWGGSEAFVNALRTMNESVASNDVSVTTANGQAVPFQSVDRINYVEKLTPVNDDGYYSYEMSIATVMPGISMSIIPRITSRNDVSMQIAFDMKELNALDSFEAGDVSATLPNESTTTITESFNTRNGQTALVQSFERVVSKADVTTLGLDDSLWAAGGRKNGGKTKKMTIILVTPYVMAR
ncbi:type II secretion system protein GspD [Vibrio breoganii]